MLCKNLTEENRDRDKLLLNFKKAVKKHLSSLIFCPFLAPLLSSSHFCVLSGSNVIQTMERIISLSPLRNGALTQISNQELLLIMEVNFSEEAHIYLSCLQVLNEGNACEHGGVKGCYSYLLMKDEWESDLTHNQACSYYLIEVYCN